jgi:hypothetical protein
MSDPVSSMDVEDVLSSIRRLVSEEAKSNGNVGESATEIASADLHEAAEKAANGPLSEIVQAMEDDGSENEDVRPAGIPPSNEAVGEDDRSRAMNSDDSDGEISFRHKSPGLSRQESDQKLVLTAAFRVSDTDDKEEEPAQTAEAATPTYPHLRPVADLVQTDISDVDADADNEDAVDEPNFGIVKPGRFEFSPEDTLFDRARLAMESVRQSGDLRRAADAEASDTPPEEPPVEILEATGMEEDAEEAEISAAISASEPDTGADAEVEPDFAKAEEPTASASPFTALGGAFAEAKGAIETELVADEEEEPSTINFAEDEGSMLDEEGLRDLVSDMVRDELQGELGDRITRNVRKLVRREIQRALASREFE